MLSPATRDALARHLDDGLRARREVDRLTLLHPDLDADDAYAIQAIGLALRQARGEQVIAYKMGLTSAAKRLQMNLASPIYGVLTDRMQVQDGGTFVVAEGIHPRIEPEIAFRLARPLQGTVTMAEALAACDGVTTALEILDSRFLGFKYFSLPDVIADNASSSHFVLSGTWLAPEAVDFADVPMSMRVDGVEVQAARSSAISGHPAASLVQLCALLAERGQGVPAGAVVLAGAAAPAVALVAGQTVTLVVEGMPGVSLRAV